MTQKDKELLLKDLSARLPYIVICSIGLEYPLPLQRIFVDRFDGILLDFYEDGDDYQVYLSEVKPYLRPMSSMTEEEKREYNNLCDAVPTSHYEFGDIVEDIELYDNFASIDWLNAHHFDYRGLIEKNLALEAPKDMYNL